jgi:hypothetical protein
MRASAGRPVPGIGRLRSLAHRRALGGDGLLASEARTGAPRLADIGAVLTPDDADRREFARRLSLRLYPLVQRGVPPRVIEAAPAPRACRLRFADGTTVLVQVSIPGEVGALAVTMRHGSLKPTGCTTDQDGSAHLFLSSSAENRWLSLHVVGLDQPD